MLVAPMTTLLDILVQMLVKGDYMGKFTQSVLNVDSITPVEHEWKLVESGTLTIQDGDTSTSQAKIKNTDITAEEDYLYYFKAIKRNKPINTLAYCENVMRVYKPSSASSAFNTAIIATNTRISSELDAFATSSVSSQGLFIGLSSGKLAINKKYNATNTPNWFGTYDYEIYELDLSKVGE